MPLILAIEPDKRQSTQLANLVKGLQAELVQRGNAADGLDALQGRVPDLVLTTSLISPRDDSALAAHLRQLGAAAAHVQTVTIPLLGTAAPMRARSGMLAALRREKPQAPMTDGCAPDVFAEQIRQYLATAHEQKVTAATRSVVAPEADVAVEEAAQPVETIAELEAAPLVDEMPAQDEMPELVAAFSAPEPEPVADAPVFASEPWPADADPVDAVDPIAAAPVVEAPSVVEAALFVETAPVAEPEPTAEAVEADTAPDEFLADEPAGLPLSQLLQLVSERSVRAGMPNAPAASGELETVATVEPEPFVEFEPANEPATIEPEPVVELAAAQLEPASDPDDIFVDPVAAQALEELSRLAPPSSLADNIPADAPVPVVEMHSFQSLDSIASELAAGPSARHESLDDLASLFAASPGPSRHEAEAVMPAAQELAAPLHGDTNLFASLFAKPAPPTAAAPIVVPGIDPSLFASAPAAPAVVFEPEPDSLTALTVEIEQFEAAEPVPAEPEPVLAEPEPVLAAIPAPVLEAAPEPVLEAAPEPVFETWPEPVVETAPQPVFAEPMLAEIASPDPEPALAAAIELEPEPLADDMFVTFEPVVFEPAYDEPAGVAAASAFDEEEVSLDVDSFEAAPAEPAPAPQAPAEPSRFSFTFVDGFGDTWSEFEAPTVAAMAADLGVGEHPPLDPNAGATPRTATPVRHETAGEPLAAPALDEEALSLIGNAARKVGLDALVIEEFERGFPGRRAKKTKKKAHAGATQVTPAAERPAKPARRPVQDEWGMFDPEQCGFAALEEEEGAETRPTTGTRVRVISY
jgi:hypothetical protein